MTNKDFVLDTMNRYGRKMALDLREKAKDMTDTEIIDEESFIPDFIKKDYSSHPVGTPVKDGEQVYGLIQPYDARNYEGTPATLPALWGLKHTKNPKKAKPYVTPLGTSGLYMKDECCIWEDKTYMSVIDNNSWTPSGYPAGWQEVSNV